MYRFSCFKCGKKMNAENIRVAEMHVQRCEGGKDEKKKR